MQTIRIILSAAKSLQQEKLELADLVENLNHSLESRNANILMLVWDGSEAEKNDFKDKISDTDLCLTLYYDTFDESTQSELETAYQSLCEGKNPKKIYVYFKDGETVPDKLQAFRDSFPTKYGHFYCSFSNIDTLKADFLLQFMEYQSKNLSTSKMLEVKNGKVTIDGKEYVDLKNVPFAGNNEEYNLLLKGIKKTQKLLAITEEDDPDYADYAAELQDMKEKLSKMESSLWDTALMITHLSTTKCSERLKRAMDLFTAGDNKGAQAVLNEEEIDKDIQHNINLIKLGEEGKKGLKTNVDEYLLKIRSIKNQCADGWRKQAIKLYNKVLPYCEMLLEIRDYIEILADYGDLLFYEEEIDNSIVIYDKALFLLFHNKDYFIDEIELYVTQIGELSQNLSMACSQKGDYGKAISSLENALQILDIGNYTDEMCVCENALIHYQLGEVYHKYGDTKVAIKNFEKAISIWKTMIENDSIIFKSQYIGDILKSLAQISLITSNDEDLLDTARLLTKDYHNLDGIDLYLSNHLAGLLTNEAILHYDNSLAQKAEQAFNESLIIREFIYSKEPLAFFRDLLKSLNNIALFYARENKIAKAVACYTKAMTICEENLGNNHPETIVSYNHLAWTYHLMGKYVEALPWAKKAAVAFPNNPNIIDTLACVYQGLGRYDEALEQFELCLKLYKKQEKTEDDIRDTEEKIKMLKELMHKV